jgi:hypothetical protein
LESVKNRPVDVLIVGQALCKRDIMMGSDFVRGEREGFKFKEIERRGDEKI